MPETAAIDQVKECKTMSTTGTMNPAPGTIGQVRATSIEVFEPMLTSVAPSICRRERNWPRNHAFSSAKIDRGLTG